MEIKESIAWNKLNIEDFAIEKRTVTREDIIIMRDFSGDCNPIHFDEDYARETLFKKTIAHGLFCLSMISKVIGMTLPGPGAIFLNEELNYRRPVYVDDEICTRVSVVEINYDKAIILVRIECTNQNNNIVLEGKSLLKMI